MKLYSPGQAAAAQVKTDKLTTDLESAKEEISNLVPRSELVHTLPGHERERERDRERGGERERARDMIRQGESWRERARTR